MCECESSETRGCINPSSPDGEVCSGKGACSCGRCDCFPSPTGVQLFSGDFCECDNNRCPFYLGEPCGGAERGTCLCDGTCDCKDDYEHGDFSVVSRCECPREDSVPARMACTADYNDTNALVCSGNGQCHCGACICDRGPGQSLESPLYEGPFCEVCTGCQSACSNLKACVECLLLRNGQCGICMDIACGSDDDCRATYEPPTLSTTPLFNTTFPLLRANAANRLCSFIVSECTWDVLILSNLTGMEPGILLVPNLRLCPEVVQWWYYLIGAIGITVLIGVALLILIRMFAKYLEHRQFKKFDKEARMTTFQMGVSPIFVSPDQEIHNPAYQRKPAQKTDQQEVKNPIYQKRLVHL
ncbi:Integrin beta-PS isoform X1 [Oopsacas minuta]|uniref:Integrin beta-PS isoform X1 n=1 Tax=Oopsacas minuta TaxID=111878 RepID=A0AAV7JE56_9METZ|nr:Integrin beta-PS isoform X1 [Oopsacas minuta]